MAVPNYTMHVSNKEWAIICLCEVNTRTVITDRFELLSQLSIMMNKQFFMKNFVSIYSTLTLSDADL